MELKKKLELCSAILVMKHKKKNLNLLARVISVIFIEAHMLVCGIQKFDLFFFPGGGCITLNDGIYLKYSEISDVFKCLIFHVRIKTKFLHSTCGKYRTHLKYFTKTSIPMCVKNSKKNT